MFTFVTWPKPFSGPANDRQRAAIRSWTQLDRGSDVLLVGDEDGVGRAAIELGVEHAPAVKSNEFGTALLDDVLRAAFDVARHDLLCLINCDVVLFEDFPRTVERVASTASRFLIVGRCRDVDERYANEPLDALWRRAQDAPLRDPGALDFFIFSRDLYRDVPPFALGRAGFDNWLVYEARRSGAGVYDATAALHAVHLRHDYNHVDGGRAWSYAGAEARRNVEYAGGWHHLFNVDDATHRILPDGIRRNRRARIRAFLPARRLGLALGRLFRRGTPVGTLEP